ncbi:GTPase IMAP family member 8-like [Scomber scombrus]|uniref:GTPase IMAP family member 8-like n=1 Tax=Scomber scombrus TaxID=13677 RepID=A0AAV1QEN8_SCOSC
MAAAPVSELRVVLLGDSWSERSSVGNFILGKTEFNTEEEPDYCQRARGLLKEKEIVLINTPDLLHPNITQHKLREHVENCVRLSDPGPHVFLLVLQPEDFTEQHKKSLQSILELFSDQSFDYSVILSKPREESSGSVEKDQTLKDLIRMCKDRYLEQNDLQLPQLLTHLGQIVKDNNKHLSCDLFEDAAPSLQCDQTSLQPGEGAGFNSNPKTPEWWEERKQEDEKRKQEEQTKLRQLQEEFEQQKEKYEDQRKEEDRMRREREEKERKELEENYKTEMQLMKTKYEEEAREQAEDLNDFKEKYTQDCDALIEMYNKALNDLKQSYEKVLQEKQDHKTDHKLLHDLYSYKQEHLKQELQTLQQKQEKEIHVLQKKHKKDCIIA